MGITREKQIGWRESEVVETLHSHTPEELAQRRAHERAARRRILLQRLIALVLAGAVLFAITFVSGKPGPPPTLLQAKGSGTGYLAAGSPKALARNILISDDGNNRVAVISPQGQLAWTMRVLQPTDAYLSPSKRAIIVTQQNAFALLKLGVASGKLDFLYGKAGQAGAAHDRLNYPRTGQQLVDGRLVVADMSNCRILFLRPPSLRPEKVLGRTGVCVHHPPSSFAYPDAAFPTAARGLVVTESRPGNVDLLSPTDRLIRSLRVPGLRVPYDANEFAAGKLIATSHSLPGAVEEFTSTGRMLWRYAPSAGAGELDRPTLATVLPNGDVLVCDSGNDRVVVIDPASNAIVWQYGQTGRPGSRPGQLDAPGNAILLP